MYFYFIFILKKIGDDFGHKLTSNSKEPKNHTYLSICVCVCVHVDIYYVCL
jgi:hypothetical protein